MARHLILDTGVIIGFERRGWDLRSLIGDDEPAIAAITAMELLSGVGRVRSAHHEVLGLNVEALLAVMPVETYSVKVARVHALLQTHARAAGRPRGSFDLIIAATAMATGSVLLTTDTAACFGDLPGLTSEVVGVG